ncbi:type IV toxin-antitoxin system AbiEi family antitoxin domain-containing protein [Sphingomonas sp. NPDC092331]|jgi:predicted transcriptional regulator of viral defense system|uniref:type IV toxin-antitoxin system AbiEi family antitoxin domain-containing protein n=1 Tax=unclassified Sphingomonas TaxID=196159 RepID=UPI0031F59AB9
MDKSPRKYNTSETQGERARKLLAQHGMMRIRELETEGIAATTIARLLSDGTVMRLSRGLYQLVDAEIDANHDLAEAAKRVPKGVVCLTSALAFHELTDQMPRKVWMAIGHRDWTPADHGPRLKVVRMSDSLLRSDVETHMIENVGVPMFTIPRTLIDCFRHRKSVGINVAVEALRETLRQRKATPAVIAECARKRGAWSVMAPYLETLTLDG